MHDHVPDFLVRLKDLPDTTVILETKGFDLLAEVKASAAARLGERSQCRRKLGLVAI
jgi:hypothetical protein